MNKQDKQDKQNIGEVSLASWYERVILHGRAKAIVANQVELKVAYSSTSSIAEIIAKKKRERENVTATTAISVEGVMDMIFG